MLTNQAAQVASSRAAQPPSEAERRQLTVMFCDLVDSTALASHLDLEDLREVIRAYQATCAEVIQRFDGHIAQYLGDGLLVYFGYPHAHEDDAHRAVYTGLGMVEAMDTLNTRLERDKAIRLAIRLGIHTGLVVIGVMGGGGRQEELALGDTPNIAARLQSLAHPNTIIISEATFRLVQGYFVCQNVGTHALKGVAQPLLIYRVLHESGTQTRLDVAATRGLTPLVGRSTEVALLLDLWEQVKKGRSQVIELSGEAGIGKSRLVQVVKDHVADEPHIRWECRCSPYYQHTAWYPLIDLFHHTLHWQADDTPDDKLGKLEHAVRQYSLALEETVPLLANLLSLPLPEERYPPLGLSPQRQRQKTLEVILAMLLELAEQQPVLFSMEDLHWADPSTLEFLSLVVDQARTASLYTLLTYRPEFQAPWVRAHVTSLVLPRLPSTQVEVMVDRMTGGKPLPAEVMQHLVEKTDGVPLFVEEMTKTVLESRILKDVKGQYELRGPLPALTIPTTLQDSLMARLDRLATAKGIAQLGATLGRQFSYDLLQAVSQLDTTTLQHELQRLVDAELLYQQDPLPLATYIFKHALIQDVAYQSLLKSTRQQYHRRIAQTLEERFPEITETQPELLAHHYSEAALYEPAIPYYQKAGQRAIQRSANVEAVGHLTKGLALLKTLPELAAHTQQELDLQIALGPALVATKGYTAPETEQAYTRARELCQQGSNTSLLSPVLRGLYSVYIVRGDNQKGRDVAEQLMRLAQRAQDAPSLLEAHRALGTVLLFMGELAPARAQLEQGIALYEPQRYRSHTLLYGQDPAVACLPYVGLSLWYLGYPDQALERVYEAFALAQKLSHPFSMAYALYFAARLHQLQREGPAAQEQAEALIALATRQSFTQWLANGLVLRGAALATQGQGEEGITQMRQGLAAYRATGSELWRTWYLALLAEACGKTGRIAEGLDVVAEALAAMEKTEQRYHEAECHRLKGELLLRQAVPAEHQAETSFRQALDVARHQQAKSLELRAAMSLSRLLKNQPQWAEVRQLLAGIYGWFTEGFATADLQEAKALLGK
jgi:predicted ATPase/class 3 adenylate cyclase